MPWRSEGPATAQRAWCYPCPEPGHGHDISDGTVASSPVRFRCPDRLGCGPGRTEVDMNTKISFWARPRGPLLLGAAACAACCIAPLTAIVVGAGAASTLAAIAE